MQNIENNEAKPLSNNLVKRVLFVIFGTLSLILGSIGIGVPGIPVTPLLLLSAYLYSKSSPKLHKLLMESNFLGRYIKNYTSKGGMSVKTKIYAITFMSIMIAISTIFFIKPLAIRIIVWSLGVIGFVVMGFVVKTVK